MGKEGKTIALLLQTLNIATGMLLSCAHFIFAKTPTETEFDSPSIIQITSWHLEYKHKQIDENHL